MTRPLRTAVTILVAFLAAPLAAQQPTLDRHFLSSDEFFVAPESLSGAFDRVAVARQVIGPTAQRRGEAQFLIVASGAGYEAAQLVWTRYYWHSRPAALDDIALGARVFCLNRTEDDVYRAPRGRDEALHEGWWSTVVSDLSDVSRQEVRADTRRLNIDCLRVNAATAPSDAPAAASATYDAHFLAADEYFIAPGERSWTWDRVAVARLLAGPTATSRGRAQFLVVGPSAGYGLGDRVWTQHYWRSRAATTEDAVVGKRVFCLGVSANAVYRAPRDRGEALNAGWWTLTITDVSNLARQEVQCGIYRLNANCLRVER